MSETWLDIAGYEGYYQVSSLGRVKSLVRPYVKSEIILAQCINSQTGYPTVNLRKNGKGLRHNVHTLVCQAFHGPRPEGLVVAHKDGDKTNNRKDNLRWATRSENEQDKLAHGTYAIGENSPCAKLTRKQVLDIRRRYKFRCPVNGIKPMAEEYGLDQSTLSKIINRHSYSNVS